MSVVTNFLIGMMLFTIYSNSIYANQSGVLFNIEQSGVSTRQIPWNSLYV